MSDPNENPTSESESDQSAAVPRAAEQTSPAGLGEQNTEPNPPLPQLYGQDMQGHDAAEAESGEDIARADREPDDR